MIFFLAHLLCAYENRNSHESLHLKRIHYNIIIGLFISFIIIIILFCNEKIFQYSHSLKQWWRSDDVFLFIDYVSIDLFDVNINILLILYSRKNREKEKNTNFALFCNKTLRTARDEEKWWWWCRTTTTQCLFDLKTKYILKFKYKKTHNLWWHSSQEIIELRTHVYTHNIK